MLSLTVVHAEERVALLAGRLPVLLVVGLVVDALVVVVVALPLQLSPAHVLDDVAVLEVVALGVAVGAGRGPVFLKGRKTSQYHENIINLNFLTEGSSSPFSAT